MSVFLLAALWIGGPPPLHPQAYLYGRASFPTGSAPRAMAWGDFDGDGVQDLATGGAFPPSFSVLLGTPRGLFRLPRIYPTPASAQDVAVGDFDQNGIADVVVVSSDCGGCFGGWVSIFLGHGDGTFGHFFDVPNVFSPRSVSVGDFDEDGIEDLAIAGGDPWFASGGELTLLTGLGDGTFSAPSPTPISPGVTAMATVDLDSDGHLDRVTTHHPIFANADGVEVSIGNGDGTFRPPTRYSLPRGQHAVETADLDADGDLDLVISNDAATVVSVLLNNGYGRFPSRTNYEVSSRTWGVAIGDLGHDGSPDLIVTSSGTVVGGGSVMVLQGNGDGSFQPFREYRTGFGLGAVLAGCIDADSDLDLVVSNPYGVTVLLGTGEGTLVTPSCRDAGEDPAVVAPADFDDDGNLDLAVADGTESSLSLLLGNGDGTFDARTGPWVGRFPTAMIALDLDDDDRADVAVTNRVAGTVSVLLGDGAGGMAPRTAFATCADPRALTSGDFDENGTLDLAVVGSGVSIHLGAGDGSFLPRIEASGGGGSIARADFDGDGHLDLATTSDPSQAFAFGRVEILRGDGTGTFAFATAMTVHYGATSVVAKDFDEDSIPDLAVTGQGDHTASLFIFLGNGDGTFQLPTLYFFPGIDARLSCGDLDGDDRPDLAVSSRTSRTVTIFSSRGDGTFTFQASHGVGGEPRSFALGRFDEDPLLDMAVATPGCLALFRSGP